MTNYENDTLDLIPGNTPKEKYEWVKNKLSENETSEHKYILMAKNQWESGNKLDAVRIIRNNITFDLASAKAYCEINFK